MKKKVLDELKTKTLDELKVSLSDLRAEIGNIKINSALSKEKNTNLLKNKRKEIARILTFMTIKSYAEKVERKDE